MKVTKVLQKDYNKKPFDCQCPVLEGESKQGTVSWSELNEENKGR